MSEENFPEVDWPYFIGMAFLLCLAFLPVFVGECCQ